MSASTSRLAVPVEPNRDHVRSGVGKGPVSAWLVRFVGSFQILAVDVFILGRSWLTLDAMILASSFGLFDSKARYFQHFVLMVKKQAYVP